MIPVHKIFIRDGWVPLQYEMVKYLLCITYIVLKYFIFSLPYKLLAVNNDDSNF